MSHELSRRHQDQIAEKAAIIANTAFGLGRTAERNRILEELIKNKVMRIDALGLLCFVNCNSLKVEYSKIFDITKEEETNDGSN